MAWVSPKDGLRIWGLGWILDGGGDSKRDWMEMATILFRSDTDQTNALEWWLACWKMRARWPSINLPVQYAFALFTDQPPASIGCLTPRQAAAPLPKRDVALSYMWLDQYNKEIRRKPIKIQAIWNSGPDTVRWDAKAGRWGDHGLYLEGSSLGPVPKCWPLLAAHARSMLRANCWFSFLKVGEDEPIWVVFVEGLLVPMHYPRGFAKVPFCWGWFLQKNHPFFRGAKMYRRYPAGN